MGSVDTFPSPESTVTTLLRSSGRLRSSLHPEPLSSIKYKDRDYESASDALDAYIADFQLSESVVGHLELSGGKGPTHRNRSRFKNKDVLKENLTDQELDFLKLPFRKPRDSDHISMTTDDLMRLPIDGSLPVTRTSAFLSRMGCYRSNSSCWTRSRPGVPSDRVLDSSSASRSLNVNDLHASGPSESRVRPSVKQQLPRWMTSRRSQMDFSGVTSVPDLKYPAWLDQCSVSTEPQSLPSWVNEHYCGHSGSSRNARLCDDGEPFRGDLIDSLIQRAEEVLKSPTLGFGGPSKQQHGSPGNSEELLEAERSWDNPPVMFKSPVPVGSPEEPIIKSLKDPKEKLSGSGSSGYSSRKHPGPVEALKHMLFSLQSVEQKVLQPEDNDTVTDRREENQDEKFLQPDGDYDSAPGGQSLMRALHHLGRLKSLVDEMNERKGKDSQQAGVARANC